MTEIVKKVNIVSGQERIFNGKLLKKRDNQKEVHIIRGFYLPPALFKVCLAELKSYGYLKQNLKSMIATGEKLANFTELVEKKVNVELKLGEMDMAFASLPDKYRAPMEYMLTTNDTDAIQRMKLENLYEMEFKEAREWLKKLIYFYAEIAGYPVPHSGSSYTMEVSDDGKVEIVYL